MPNLERSPGHEENDPAKSDLFYLFEEEDHTPPKPSKEERQRRRQKDISDVFEPIIREDRQGTKDDVPPIYPDEDEE